GLIRVRRPAGDEAVAGAVIFRISDDRAQKIFLVDKVKERLTHLRFIERRMQVIYPNCAPMAVDCASADYLDIRITLEDRQKIDRRLLKEIDLARDKRLHAGLRIIDPDQLDPINLRDLRTCEA